MLKGYDFDGFPGKYAEQKTSELGEELARLQRKLIDAGIPVMVIIEGWEGAGHEYIINDLIRELNPRNYHVKEYDYSSRFATDKPFMWEYWQLLPKKGDMSILDRSYYFNLLSDLKLDKKDLKKSKGLIKVFEKQLTDDNMLILKFFLHIKKKTLQERIAELKGDRNRAFFVTEIDEKQCKDYKEYRENFENILKKTDFGFARWNVISSQDLKDAAKEVIGKTIEEINKKLKFVEKQKAEVFERKPYDGPKPLDDVDLTLSVDDAVYDNEIDKLQERAQELTYALYNKKIPTILVFEGMDAAGKGGAIERLTRIMDARFYDVVPIAAPREPERSYHYLWRFYREFPSGGKMAVFDRSWYGRVMVERIEGFVSEREWSRAYDEINEMEEQLCGGGALVVKFFLAIDKDEQLKRFKDRESDLDKVYKITDEDWRNRSKWDLYIEAMNEMLVKTNTKCAPWVIVEGNDKKFARLKVLREFILRAEEVIKAN